MKQQESNGNIYSGNADLHTHTYYSDGLLSPEELVKEAALRGLAAVAITDHDSIDGIDEAMDAASFYHIEVIPGVELTAYEGRIEVHILGFFVQLDSEILMSSMDAVQDARRDRLARMMEQLKAIGIDVASEDIIIDSKNKSVGRLHLAEALVKKNVVGSISEAFNKYLGNDGPVWSPKYDMSVADVIKLVKAAGGVSVLAHPGVLNHDELIPYMVSCGLNGIEACYPRHATVQEDYYRGIARKHGLCISGGSDYHGPGRSAADIGQATITAGELDKIRALAKS